MPWSKVFAFTDPFPYQAAIRAADVELFPTARGEFRAELTQINLNQLWMQRFHEKLPQVFASKIRPGRRVIGFLTGEQPAIQHCGMDLSPRDLVICNYDVMHHRTSGNCRFGAMSLTTDDFDAACKAVAGHEFSGSPLQHLVRPNAALMSRLLELHAIVGQLAKTTPDILVLPEVARSLEQELIHLMVRCTIDSASSGMTTGGRRHAAVPDRNLRWYRRGGANPPRRLRGAFGNGADPLSQPAENAPGQACASACRSFENRNASRHRSRLLGAGTLRRRLSGTVRGVTFGDIAPTFRGQADISQSPVVARGIPGCLVRQTINLPFSHRRKLG